MNPRQTALLILQEIETRQAFADVALDRHLQKTDLSDANRRLATELVYGCVRRKRSLDAIIDRLAKKKSQKQPPLLRLILHLGLYQLRHLQQIPPSAAVNTTVELAKENRLGKLAGVVNGILRQYLRLADLPDAELLQLPENPVGRLAVLHSFPDWIVEFWSRQLGLAETEELCQWFNQPPTIHLRVNPLKTSLPEVEVALEKVGVAVSRIPPLPFALKLTGAVGNIRKLPGFHEGWWMVQDASAQLVTYLLNPQPGETIIDVCAAPGGKTTHIAELMGDKGEVFAGDRSPSRLKKLRQNAARLELSSISTVPGDCRELTQFVGRGDRVLLDVPCSGLGTLHRRADARWRQTSENIRELGSLQRELLETASTWVKSGGVLVYATCTIHPWENDEVIEDFLASHPDWSIEPPPTDFMVPPEAIGWVKVWPHRYHLDGFFMVRLINN
jgi:16S rRNA (cytosine967-C5)-methyltransferase